jgi:acyl carrier protein
LRAALSAQLPDYMIPAAFVFMSEFPLLGPGKVNLRALPEPGSARPELDVPFALPRTAVEEALVRIWSDVLKLDRIGIHDRFLDLGGNSLMATRVIAQAGDAFDAEVTLQRFFAAPTVAGMAAVVEAQRR